jgi:hypothetical protein
MRAHRLKEADRGTDIAGDLYDSSTEIVGYFESAYVSQNDFIATLDQPLS